ncbi:hypothetical protein Cus16_3143 [Curtobacterium sp. ER1/6]|nr:hypothetical protein Cus16_3143 [Curtobacterium sp. ER1/6]
MQHVLRGDGARHVGHDRADERLDALVLGGGGREVAAVHGVDDRAVRRRRDVRRHPDQPGRADRQVREHVRVVAREVHEVGVVEHPGDLGEVALGVLHREDVRVLRRPHEGLVGDRDAGAPRDVVQDDRQVGGVRDHPEVREHARLGGLVVVRRDDHDAVRPRPLALLVEVDRVRGLVRAAAGDDLRPTGGHGLADLDQSELLRVGQRARLTRGPGHDDAVGTGRDAVVDVLLDAGPVDLAVGRERRHEGDEDLTEGILTRGHAHQRTGDARRGCRPVGRCAAPGRSGSAVGRRGSPPPRPVPLGTGGGPPGRTTFPTSNQRRRLVRRRFRGSTLRLGRAPRAARHATRGGATPGSGSGCRRRGTPATGPRRRAPTRRRARARGCRPVRRGRRSSRRPGRRRAGRRCRPLPRRSPTPTRRCRARTPGRARPPHPRRTTTRHA